MSGSWGELEVAAPQLVEFFRRGADGTFAVPQCAACGLYQWPPRALCRRCQQPRLEWTPAAAVGEVYSWTTGRRPDPDGAGTATPLIVVVELDLPDPVRLVGRLVDSAESISIGQRVEGRFVPSGGPTEELPVLIWAAI